jgi:carbon-monoxide dehydrogenase large subunit
MHSVPDGGIGAPVQRREDERLLTGTGHYADDTAIPHLAYAILVRSPHAHARIAAVDTQAARAAPGVLAVLTAEDAARQKLGGLPVQQFPRTVPGTDNHCPTQPLLASEKVRYVGDRVALVVAETLAQAKDAAELVSIRYEMLRAVTLRDALAADAPKVWDEAQSNLAFQIETGDRAKVEAQFAAAAHVTKVAMHYPRVTANSMEPRCALAYRDPIDGRFTLVSSTQNPFRVRDILCTVLGLPPNGLRVRVMDVGGGFGMKNHAYPEEALVVWAARTLNRPVKWTADRSEGLCSDQHARHQITEAALALDRTGRILALRTNVQIDVGSCLSGNAGVPPTNTGNYMPGVYNLPIVHTTVRAAFTNTSHLGPYRGSGKPEASLLLERLVDKAAREMGIDTVELRRRNLVRPADMPFRTASGNVYDCGNFERVLDQTLVLADWQGFAQRRALTERRGLKRGIGMAMYCAFAGRFSERMEIRVAENGSVAIYAGTLATGQGHETMFAQMVSDWLGVPFASVQLFQGDTDKVLFGRGTFAQRSTSIGGSALKAAADEVVKKARRLCAFMMEADEADIVFERGQFRVSGTDRQVSFGEVAQKSYMLVGVPPEFGVGIDGVGSFPGHFTFPNGCMIAEVEVDPETGCVTVDRISCVDDSGVVINPLTIEGQVHGSIAQGLGESLMEEIIYDPSSGQLLSGSFLDYAIPHADVMPDIRSEFAPVPTKLNLIGTKGGSEPGNTGAPPSIVNAIIDALAPYGITDLPVPATSERIWRALAEAAMKKS